MNQPIENIHFETQLSNDTCFRHAINHYFQKNYVEIIRKYYRTIVITYQTTIQNIKYNSSLESFYGNGKEPEESKLEEKSTPEINEDLYSYYQIYLATSALDLLEQLEECDYKQLSPSQVLFLLEFQLQEITEEENNYVILKYIPHRFYHRYARSKIEKDNLDSIERFIDITNNLNYLINSLFLCHIQPGKAHAFAAIRSNNQWILLDSLLSSPYYTDNKNLFEKTELAGRASVLIIKNENKFDNHNMNWMRKLNNIVYVDVVLNGVLTRIIGVYIPSGRTTMIVSKNAYLNSIAELASEINQVCIFGDFNINI